LVEDLAELFFGEEGVWFAAVELKHPKDCREMLVFLGGVHAVHAISIRDVRL
jgi:hypothetical protein